MHFVSSLNIFISFIIFILYLCYNDTLVLYNLFFNDNFNVIYCFYLTRTLSSLVHFTIKQLSHFVKTAFDNLPKEGSKQLI